MRSRLYVRLMALIAGTMVIAALGMAAILRQQTISEFVVYLSRQEAMEQFQPQQRVILRFEAERLATALKVPDARGIDRIVDTMAASVGRDVMVVRNLKNYYLSARLRDMEVTFDLDEAGNLLAQFRDPMQGSQIRLEVNPLLTVEISPFTPGVTTGADVARVYTVPAELLSPSTPTERFLTQSTRTVFAVTGVAALIVTLLVGIVLRRSLQPVQMLTTAALTARRAEDLPEIKPTGPAELRALAVAFNAMVTTIRGSAEMRNRLIADISHELRGPLANLRAQIEAMQDGLLPPDTDGLASLHEETMLLARLVRDLHELSLADAQALPLEKTGIHLETLVADTVAGMEPSYAAGNVRLRMTAAPGVPEIRADSQRIVQVLTNVLQNSLRYTPAGGEVTVTVEPWEVVGDAEIESAPESNRGRRGARITVSDTGVGVPPDEIPLIFERFYRTDPSRARDSGGSGLGLAIARSIVEAHGGAITARPAEPEGLQVTIVLPP